MPEIGALSSCHRYKEPTPDAPDHVERSLSGWQARDPERVPTTHEQTKYQRTRVQALRCNVLQRLLGEDFRGMSRRLAECALFQWFCGVDRLEEVRVPSKSQLARYFQWLPEAQQVQALVRRLVQAGREADAATGFNRLWLANELELDTVWMDSTCVAADTHFPVDWVLLRDATRTLMKATGLIRAHELKGRMPAPEQFLRAMNQQCIAMVQAGKLANAKRARKRVLREMKRLGRVVRQHARRHRELLDTHWQETDWTRGQQVLALIDGVLGQLPRAVKQARERIIGERPVANADLLSLYEGELHVIVRGKAGAALEFGNILFLPKQRQSLLGDWHQYQESAPTDSR